MGLSIPTGVDCDLPLNDSNEKSSSNDTVKTVLLIAAHEMQQDEVERDNEGRECSAVVCPHQLHLTSRQRDVCVHSTMENWLSQMGVGTKHLNERYSEYPAQAHDQQLYYTYEPSSPPHGHVASSKHHHSGGGHKGNAAMSALTLLAFLFFLHILQQCLKDHMTAMSTPQVMVVTAGREGEQIIEKTSHSNKLDKAGVAHHETMTTEKQTGGKIKNKMSEGIKASHLPTESDDNFMTRVVTAEHTPRRINPYKNKVDSNANKSLNLAGFVSAMDEN